jgi:putative transcriptional regulator
MISFQPLANTLKNKDITVYQLIRKGILSQPDINRIKRNHNYTLKFINKLCKELNCQPSDIINYIEDEDNR